MDHPIAAIATAPAQSAIGVIRLSGEGCIPAVAGIFRPLDGSAFGSGQPRRLVLGALLDRQGSPLDQAMATFSSAPHSYTGEDTAELHCHGSPTLLALVLETLLAQGVRQALPGEFTKRAFLNGKLDLLQAESVADLIDAQSPAAVHAAAGQLSGRLSQRVSGIYHRLLDLLAHFHAALDYPDEDIAPFTDATLRSTLAAAGADLQALLDTYRRGQYVKDGIPTAIVGRPNVGKSTLLNTLVGYDRAIVTHIPGTTRDTVEERCVLNGTLLRLIDTAGIRDTADPVEQIGVSRSRAAMEEAGLILVVLDQSTPPAEEDAALLRDAMELAPTILVRNKCDLPPAGGAAADLPPAPTVTGSAARSPERLVRALGEEVDRLFPRALRQPGEMLTNLRQFDAAGQALAAVGRAQDALRAGVTADFLLTDVEEALAALGALTGRNLQEDTVERIFSRFCVGK